MQTRWQAPESLRLWVLAWLLAATCATLASPLIQPRSLELACSGTGQTVLLVRTADGLQAADVPGIDCPLCLPTGLPPPLPHSAPPPPHAAFPMGTAVPWRLAVLPLRQRPPARAPPPPFFH